MRGDGARGWRLTVIDSFDYENLLLPLTRLQILQHRLSSIGFSVKNDKFNRTRLHGPLALDRSVEFARFAGL